MSQRNSHCHFCGAKYLIVETPLKCAECKQTVWFNPLPIVVVVVPVIKRIPLDPSIHCNRQADHINLGYLAVRRGIHPVGELCFPGGYVEKHETWQDAAMRETLEETGTSVTGIRLKELISIDGFLAILCTASPVEKKDVNWTFTTGETQEVVLLTEPCELAFKVQTKLLSTLKFGEWF